MPGIEETLRTFRDVQGVYGSFVVAGSGALVARDLPSVYDGSLFAEVGPRVMRLYETLVGGVGELDACVVRYAEHKLYLRRMTWGFVGIIASIAVNMPALRMVANLVVRRIDPDVSPGLRPSFTPPPPRLASTPPLAASPSPSAFPPAVRSSAPPPAPPREEAPVVVPQDGRDSAPPATDRHVRMYRGRRIIDE